MKDVVFLFCGCGLSFTGLILWLLAWKHTSESNRAYINDILMGNQSFLLGVLGLVATGWLPGGERMAFWLIAGV